MEEPTRRMSHLADCSGYGQSQTPSAPAESAHSFVTDPNTDPDALCCDECGLPKSEHKNAHTPENEAAIQRDSDCAPSIKKVINAS